MLVELHDQPDVDLGPRIASRFSETHEAEYILQADRCLEDLPFRLPGILERTFRRLLLRAMNERRVYRMRWLYLKLKP